MQVAPSRRRPRDAHLAFTPPTFGALARVDVQKWIAINERALVRLRFERQPEYLRMGGRLLLREGCTKCIGQIVRTFPYSSPASPDERHPVPEAPTAPAEHLAVE